MLIYPKNGGMWHHITSREMCQEVFSELKDKTARIICFDNHNPKGFNTPDDSLLLLCYLLNTYGTGNIKLRAWTLD